MDGIWVGASDLFDLDATLRRGHEHDPSSGPVDDRAEVILLGDVDGAAHDDLADGNPFDVHTQDLGADLGRLVGAGRELHAAGLASPAHENLRLDHHPGIAGINEALRRRLDLAVSPGQFPGWNWQPLGYQQGLRVRFLNFHAWPLQILASRRRISKSS